LFLGPQLTATTTDLSGNTSPFSLEEALRMYTLNGAYASFEEGSSGEILYQRQL
jgi:predicted amidohydrolase YtcJ